MHLHKHSWMLHGTETAVEICWLKKFSWIVFFKIHKKTYMLEPLFNNVSSLQPTTLLKVRLRHGCFPVNFVKFFRRSFSKNTCRQLLVKSRSEILKLNIYLGSTRFTVTVWKKLILTDVTTKTFTWNYWMFSCFLILTTKRVLSKWKFTQVLLPCALVSLYLYWKLHEFVEIQIHDLHWVFLL